MDRLEVARDALNNQMIRTDAALAIAVNHMLEELQELRDNQEPSQYQDFDWSQAKPGMAFKDASNVVVWVLTWSPFIEQNVVVSTSSKFLYKHNICFLPITDLTRAPEHDVDWSHIQPKGEN